MTALRDYQARDLARLTACRARRILFVATVAYGKSLMIQALTEQERGPVLILSNRRQVIRQLRERIGAAATVMTIQTAARRLDQLPTPTLILADEIHKGGAARQYLSVFDRFPLARVIGFTGSPTPDLFEVFEEVIEGESAAALTASGHLAPLRYFAAPGRLDLAGIRTVAGDFEATELILELGRAKITGDAIDAYRRHAMGRPCLAFAVNVAHAEQIRSEFRAIGIYPEVLTGSDKDAERERKLAFLRAGGLLVNIDTLTEGYDFDRLHAILDLAPTLSLARHLQRHGRVARAAVGKAAGLVLDCAGNTLRHGTITESRDWREGGAPSKERQTADGELLSIRQCDHCLAIHETGPTHCPSCGTAFAKDKRISVAHKERLEELQAEALERARKILRRGQRNEEAQAKTLADFQRIAAARGYKPGWAFARHKLRQDKASQKA